MSPSLRPLLPALAFLAVAACGDASTLTSDAEGLYSDAPIAVADARVSGALVSGESVVLFPGDSARIVISPRDAAGNPVRVRSLEFLVGGAAAGVSVDARGLVRATSAPGGALVWARVNGVFVTDTVRVVVLPRNDTPRIAGRWRLIVADETSDATLEGTVQAADSLLPSPLPESAGVRLVVLSVTAAYCSPAQVPRCGAVVAWPLTAATLGATGELSLAARRESPGVTDDLAFVARVRGDSIGGRASYQRIVQGRTFARVQGPATLAR